MSHPIASQSITLPPLASTILFHPIKVGCCLLQHRIVMAPLTRYRANDAHVPTDLAVEYYAQRASTPGTLLITEATYVSHKSIGQANVPGLYTREQLDGWKKVTDAVHARGSYIYAQMWALGRGAYPENLATEDPSLPYVSSSAKALSNRSATPRALTVPEIQSYVQDFAQAAKNAIFEAGFDGVEIHGANGYLVDQFLQDVVNERTDEYGGSIHNRARFALEIVKAVVEAIGQERTGIRLSPWSTFQEMGMKDPIPQFSYMIQTICDLYPNFAYIHLIEPDISIAKHESNDSFRKIWAPRPYLSARHNTVESAIQAAEEKGDIVVFGRRYLANPDLPLRLKKGIPLTEPDTTTFYTPKSPKGYTDYPFAGDYHQNGVANLSHI